jgi:DNA-binding transcriptional LysR family regulator
MPQPVMEWESRIGRRVRLRDLHILSCVVQAGSMAKAATRLRMSQPSISEAIANLEAALRVRLLDRGPRGVEPTIYANALLRRGRVVFDELSQGVRDIEFLADPTAGEVRIGCPENLASGFVPAVIDRISRRYPKISFHVLPVEPAAMGFRELRERSVDLMVGRILHPPLDDDLNADILFEDRLLVVAGSRSPWVRRRKIALEDLMNEPWVHIPSNTPVDAYVAAGLQAQGLTLPAPTVRTYSMHVRNYLLSTGRFLGVIWNWTLHFNPSEWSFKALPVDLGIPPRPVAIVTLKNRTLSSVVEVFIEHAREVAKSMSMPSVPESVRRRSTAARHGRPARPRRSLRAPPAR